LVLRQRERGANVRHEPQREPQDRPPDVAQEALRQERHVVASLAKWRQRERHHREPEIEILAELLALDLHEEVAFARRDHPDVDADLAVAAHPTKGPLLEGPCSDFSVLGGHRLFCSTDGSLSPEIEILSLTDGTQLARGLPFFASAPGSVGRWSYLVHRTAPDGTPVRDEWRFSLRSDVITMPDRHDHHRRNAQEERGIDSSDLGIAYRVVRADGSLRAAARANQTTVLRQHQPALAATATGFVVGWTDESGFTSGAASRVVLRAFTVSGPSGSEVVVSGSDDASDPAIALSGATGMLGYVAIDSGSGLRSVRAVRLDGTSPMGSSIALDGTTSDTHSVQLATLSDGSFAAAWVSRERDGLGDVRARGIAADGTLGPITIDTRAVSPGPEVAETEPSIAALPGGAYLVSYAVGREDTGATAVAVGDTPPELSQLQEALAASSTGDVCLVTGPDGVWVSFGLAERSPVMGALRAVYGFHLAGD